MKKQIILSLALAAASLFVKDVQAQQDLLANKPGVTDAEIRERINTLYRKQTSDANAVLLLEANALEKKNSEDMLISAMVIYDRVDHNPTKVEEVKKKILSKFPKGRTARAEAFSKIFEKSKLSADDMNKAYQTWIQDFPKNNFKENERAIYEDALSRLSLQYIQEGKMTEAITRVGEIKEAKYYVPVLSALNQSKQKSAYLTSILPLAEGMYNKLKPAFDAATNKQLLDSTTNYISVATIYADLLYQSGKKEQALQVSNTVLDQMDYVGYRIAPNVKIVSQVLAEQGKPAEALRVTERYIVTGNKDSATIAEIEPLYIKAHNGSKTGLDSYLADLNQKADTAVWSNNTTLTYKEISAHINQLFRAKNAESTRKLVMEVDALQRRTEEEYLLAAFKIYGFVLGGKEKYLALQNRILAAYPKGHQARELAFAAARGKTPSTADGMQRQYDSLVAIFPRESFKENDQEPYEDAISAILRQHIKEGNLTRALESLKALEKADIYTANLYKFFSDYNGEKPDSIFYPLVEKAYNISKAASMKPNNTMSSNAALYGPIKSLYATYLVQRGKNDEALAMVKPDLEESNYEGSMTITNANIVTGILQQQGKNAEAVAILEKCLNLGYLDSSLVNRFLQLYPKVKGTSAEAEAFVKARSENNDKSMRIKLESEMVKTKAPDFSLMDRDGKKVSLSDYKGKVVILDFWATWCIPCIGSFPAMQNAIDKYKTNPDVAFLFINTSQQEENYKELVNKFFAKHKNYTFHVLYDEMRKPENSVAKAFDVTGLPTKIVIDKEGYVRFKSAGSTTESETILRELGIKIDMASKN